MQEVERIAGELILQTDPEKRIYSLKVLDPFFNSMAVELKELNQVVSKINEARKPKPVIHESILHVKNSKELGLIVLVTLMLGISITVLVQRLTKPKVV